MPSSQQHISLAPASPTPPGDRHRHVLIYMISGSPGLIGFYQPFLSTLRQILDETSSSSPTDQDTYFHLYGQDLAGFSDADHEEPFSSINPPRDLEFQIQHTFRTLNSLRLDTTRGTAKLRPVTATLKDVDSAPETSGDTAGEDDGDKHRPFDDIILIGHSVGSYIALEVFHRNMRAQQQPTIPRLNLHSAVLLFPTITHIAQSPSGQKLDLLRRVPVLGANAYLVARGILSALPVSAVRWIVSSVLRFPAHASDVLVPWLKSRDGIWQALYMGMDEMQVIREDKWDRELWGIEHQHQAQTPQQQEDDAPPKFFMFFGRDDHWVANHYRDLFIAERNQPAAIDAGTVLDEGGSDGATRKNSATPTRIVVDEGNLPHAFCIHHSETVAEKVSTWIRELYPATRTTI